MMNKTKQKIQKFSIYNHNQMNIKAHVKTYKKQQNTQKNKLFLNYKNKYKSKHNN